jgi:hypothetical protein
MKQYQKALLAIEQTATPNARYNKLIKIASESTDDILKGLLSKSAKMYSYHLGRGTVRNISRDNALYGYIPTTHSEWANAQRVVNKELLEYVHMRIAESKPEWMVMAEKHGWGPLHS